MLDTLLVDLSGTRGNATDVGKALLQGLAFMLEFSFCRLSSAQSLAATDVLLLTDDDGLANRSTDALVVSTSWKGPR